VHTTHEGTNLEGQDLKEILPPQLQSSAPVALKLSGVAMLPAGKGNADSVTWRTGRNDSNGWRQKVHMHVIVQIIQIVNRDLISVVSDA